MSLVINVVKSHFITCMFPFTIVSVMEEDFKGEVHVLKDCFVFYQ